MRHLIVDVGNTLYKASIFEASDQQVAIETTTWQSVIDFAQKYAPQRGIVSSVREKNTPLIQSLDSLLSYPLLWLDYTTSLPITNAYDTPHTLGMDRLAGVVGAKTLYPENNCLVIDAGTCITYDFIDATGVYQGGSIAPGIRMRLEAMHTFTANLPLPDWNPQTSRPSLVSKSTEQALISGAANGTIAEAEQIIATFQEQYASTQVLVCGGDRNFFESTIKHPIFAVRNLVSIGLNRILEHNVF
ncbi:MAG: type III pantothenate kinase [Thermonemataceae bacterium]